MKMLVVDCKIKKILRLKILYFTRKKIFIDFNIKIYIYILA